MNISFDEVEELEALPAPKGPLCNHTVHTPFKFDGDDAK